MRRIEETVPLFLILDLSQVHQVLEVTKQMTTHVDDDQCVDASNVFVLSGMNDIDWNVQFKSKMLRTFQDNVYHRGAINAQIQNRIAEMTNGLCCTDECHIACGSKMKIANVLVSTSHGSFWSQVYQPPNGLP